MTSTLNDVLHEVEASLKAANTRVDRAREANDTAALKAAIADVERLSAQRAGVLRNINAAD